MKRIHISLLLALFALSTYAFDVCIDDIYYNLNGDCASVTYNIYEPYSGDIVIPETITFKGKEYSVTSIGKSAFALECKKEITSISLPNTITHIDDDAFAGCRELTSITIPNSVTYIGHSAFTCCHSLTSVVIPNSVTTIGTGAFDSCALLKEITIGKSVREIGAKAFAELPKLRLVTCYTDEMPEGLPGTRYSSIFTRDDIEEAILYVPERLYDFYRIRDPWKYFGIIKTLKEEDSISAAEIEDDPKDAEYYTIQGNKVDAPMQSGIYVVRSGKKTKTVSITQ